MVEVYDYCYINYFVFWYDFDMIFKIVIRDNGRDFLKKFFRFFCLLFNFSYFNLYFRI